MEANCGLRAVEVSGAAAARFPPDEAAGCLEESGAVRGVAGTPRRLPGLPAIDARVIKQIRPHGGLQCAPP